MAGGSSGGRTALYWRSCGITGVNCGVELADSERRCPLCHTEVHNPRQPYDRKIPKPFPNRLDLFEPEDNRGFAAAITTLLLALPAAICLACDVAYTRGAGWSMLVTGAMAMLWVFIVPPIFLRRHKVLFCGTLDTAAVLGYLWMVEHYAAKGSWFQAMAVPLVVLVDLLFTADYLLVAKVIHGRFRQMALVLASVPLLLVGVEVCLDLFLDGRVSLLWSFVVSIPCLILALLLVVLGRRERFRQQMRKRLHM